MEIIGLPLSPSVSFVPGYGGFPAYSFGPGANVGRPASVLIPPTFFRDFAISVIVKPSSDRGGMLFAIMDTDQTVIHLGLQLSAVEDGHQRVILYYTEPGSAVSREAAAFSVPVMTHRWNRFAVLVEGEEVILLVDCEEHSHAPFQRSSRALVFEPKTGLFVGSAGARKLEKFIGSIQQLTIHADPRAPEKRCEAEESSASGEASGLQETDGVTDGVAEILEADTYTQAPPKEAKVEPINTPPTPTFPSEDSELSGEPIPEGTLETTNLSAILNSSAEQGKSWVCLSPTDSGSYPAIQRSPGKNPTSDTIPRQQLVVCSRPEIGQRVLPFIRGITVSDQRSGDILNDTLEEVDAMNGVPVTDPGSGDGAFLHVTEESPHTEEDLATTVAAREPNVTISTAWDVEVAVSTAGEAEGGSVPTGGPALSMSTQDPGEGDTPSPDTEEGSAAISMEEAEMPNSTDKEAEASTVPTRETALFMSTQEPEEGVSLPVKLYSGEATSSPADSSAHHWAVTWSILMNQRIPITFFPFFFFSFISRPSSLIPDFFKGKALITSTCEDEEEEEEASKAPTGGPPPGTPTAAPEQAVTFGPSGEDLVAATMGEPLSRAEAEESGSAPPEGPPLPIPTVTPATTVPPVTSSGPPGPPGPPGLPGNPGKPGTDVFMGPPGSPGKNGAAGEPGPRYIEGSGTIRSRHEPRISGPNASNGLKGEKGDPGLKGERGMDGTSIVGPPGPRGPPGRIEVLPSSLINMTHGFMNLSDIPELTGPPGPDGMPGLPGFPVSTTVTVFPLCSMAVLIWFLPPGMLFSICLTKL
ncbi:Collagen alpha-1(XV) chain [Myotis davidii]|uniref:Collagen alpha-1(XV) chain n=1 Tax=Myotis davidii TaxID=225400 RepID=L5M777_MYODS|nr:Collagen alpha-1(XV) chain [Myotis davidii]